MSQLVSEMPDTVEARPVVHDLPSDFDYRPVPPLAPITVFLGVSAVAGLAAIPGLAVAVAGIVTGLIGLWQIRRAEGELGGRLVARLGLALSVLFLISGSALHAYWYVTEVPEGHQRVSFNWLSTQPLVPTERGIGITKEVADLEGKPIFIKGYMYPTRQSTNLTEFVLLKDTGQCCFGGNPKPTDMIVVKLKEGMRVTHREKVLVSVAGTFHASAISQSGELTGVYSLEGTHFR